MCSACCRLVTRKNAPLRLDGTQVVAQDLSARVLFSMAASSVARLPGGCLTSALGCWSPVRKRQRPTLSPQAAREHAIPNSIAQIPVPVPMSSTRRGFLIGAKYSFLCMTSWSSRSVHASCSQLRLEMLYLHHLVQDVQPVVLFLRVRETSAAVPPILTQRGYLVVGKYVACARLARARRRADRCGN